MTPDYHYLCQSEFMGLFKKNKTSAFTNIESKKQVSNKKVFYTFELV